MLRSRLLTTGAGALLAAIMLFAAGDGFAQQAGHVLDEARQAGRSAASLPWRPRTISTTWMAVPR